jgi:hypothetical protein
MNLPKIKLPMHKKPPLKLALSMGTFGIIGAVMVLFSGAAILQSINSIELTAGARGGTNSGVASQYNDTNAEGGTAMLFRGCAPGQTGTAGSCATPATTCPSGQTGTPPNCATPPATCPSGQTGSPPNCVTPPVASSSKKLLLYQGHDSVMPSYIASNVAEIDGFPFDGITFGLPGLAYATAGSSSISLATYKASMAPVKTAGLTKTTHNFVMTYVGSPGTIDTWSNVLVPNFANLADAARDAGVEGIMFDTETYDGNTMFQPNLSCPGLSIAVCRDRMYTAGKNTMIAMAARYPTLKFITNFGPSVGDPLTDQNIGSAYSPCGHRNWSSDPGNQMVSSFAIGLLAGTIGTSATYVDGGEDYDVHSDQAANAFYDWRKTGIAAQSPFVPADIKSAWSGKISLSFGALDDFNWCQYDGTSSASSAAGVQVDLTVRLKKADEYVWLFARAHRWYSDPDSAGFAHVTPDYPVAVRNARTANGLPAK